MASTTFLLLSAILSLTYAQPISDDLAANGIECGYVRPLNDLRMNDSRLDSIIDGNEITSLYTKVSMKSRWPNRIVPWEFNEEHSSFSDEQTATIEEAMQKISELTCIKFEQKTSETSYVSLTNDESGCFSSNIGYRPDTKVQVNLADGCLAGKAGVGIVIHELMHALGFEHEMTRYDRDLYVKIQWENIDPQAVFNFRKLPRTYAFPQYNFDLSSLMMYRLLAFSVNSKPTIVVTKNPDKVKIEDIGQRVQGLIGTDLSRIKSAYKCGRDVAINTLSTTQNGEKFLNFF